MRRKSTFTVILSLIMVLAFGLTAFAAAPAKKAPAKKAPVKKAAAKAPAAKAKAPAAKAVAPAAKAAAPAAKAVVPAAAGAAAGAAAATAAAPAAPAGPEGAAAMLEKSKYSNKATADLAAVVKDLPMGIGTVKIDATINTAGNNSTLNSKTDSMLVGGKDGEKAAVVPFIELVDGDKAAIDSFLKSASKVDIEGDNIVVTKAAPPASFCKLLDKLGDLSWKSKDLDLNCTIETSGGKVTAITGIKMTGKAAGKTGSYPATVSGSVKY